MFYKRNVNLFFGLLTVVLLLPLTFLFSDTTQATEQTHHFSQQQQDLEGQNLSGKAIQIENRLFFIAHGDLVIHDISDPKNPKELKRFSKIVSSNIHYALGKIWVVSITKSETGHDTTGVFTLDPSNPTALIHSKFTSKFIYDIQLVTDSFLVLTIEDFCTDGAARLRHAAP